MKSGKRLATMIGVQRRNVNGNSRYRFDCYGSLDFSTSQSRIAFNNLYCRAGRDRKLDSREPRSEIGEFGPPYKTLDMRIRFASFRCESTLEISTESIMLYLTNRLPQYTAIGRSPFPHCRLGLNQFDFFVIYYTLSLYIVH